MSFSEEVLKIVEKIPKGKVLTYKKVAEKAKKPLAWRAVGNILNRNNSQEIPCHRVVKSNGEAGGYNRGARKKIILLRKEGILFKKRSHKIKLI